MNLWESIKCESRICDVIASFPYAQKFSNFRIASSRNSALIFSIYLIVAVQIRNRIRQNTPPATIVDYERFRQFAIYWAVRPICGIFRWATYRLWSESLSDMAEKPGDKKIRADRTSRVKRFARSRLPDRQTLVALVGSIQRWAIARASES